MFAIYTLIFNNNEKKYLSNDEDKILIARIVIELGHLTYLTTIIQFISTYISNTSIYKVYMSWYL